MAEIKSIRKHIVTDEQHRPVAVQIDYEDWLEIERQLRPEAERPASQVDEATDANFDQLLDRTSGLWKEGDGLEYQRRIREEWTRPWDPESHTEE